MKVDAVKVVHRRWVTAQSIHEDAEYFPHCRRLRSDGKTLMTLSQRGEVNYTRPMSGVREIAYQAVDLA